MKFRYRPPASYDPDYDESVFDPEDVELWKKEPSRLWDELVVVLILPGGPLRVRVYGEADALYGMGHAHAVSQRGIQMEVTVWMQSLGYFPAPGRPGRWHESRPDVFAAEWQTLGGRARFFTKA